MNAAKIFLLTLMMAVSSLTAGAQSLVGTWEHTDSYKDGETISTTLTFNEDGTFVRTEEQTLISRKKQPSVLSSRAEGNWKLISGGKKIRMRYKPSSVKVDSEGKGTGFLAKLSETSKKMDAAGSLYTPKILSLTEKELVLKESAEDNIGGEETQYSVKIIYTRIDR